MILKREGNIITYQCIFSIALYIATLNYVNILFFIIPFLLSLISLKKSEFKNRVFYLLLLIGLVSVINFVFNINFISTSHFISRSKLEVFPYSIFFLFSYIIALKIDDKVLKYLLYFIIIEILVGIFQYFTGSFFEFGEQLLYNKRVPGLSSNSSVFAIKILIGFFILYIKKTKIPVTHFYSAFILLNIGLYITFNRTIILSVYSFLLIYYILNFKNSKVQVVLFFFLIGVFVTLYANEFLLQFLRNSTDKTFVLSSRDYIWKEYFKFIEAHILFGYGSSKLWAAQNWHAHNSYIMTLAANGILISSLYFILIVTGINKGTLPYLTGILISGTAQYSFFWGISFMDIFLIYIILTKYRRTKVPIIKIKSHEHFNRVYN